MEHCLLLLLLGLLLCGAVVSECPEGCKCHWVYENNTAQHYLTSCRNNGLTTLPQNISALTTHL